MSIIFDCETNIGKVRQVNEDSLWPKTNQHPYPTEHPYGMLFIVADGMGGYGAGDVASELAVKEISEKYYALGNDYPDIGNRLKVAIRDAHQKIREEASQRPDIKNMGTTVAMAVIKHNDVTKQEEAWVAWVGDSRVYLLRRGKLSQLTKDHAKIWPLIETGAIKNWEEYRLHPERSKLTNSLAAHRSSVKPEVLPPVKLEPGDQLLLCSDGLSGEVKPEEIEHILVSYPPQQAVQLLIEKANAPKQVYLNGQQVSLGGGDDNITSIVIEIPGGEPRPVSVSKPVSSKPTRAVFAIVGVLILALAGFVAAMVFGLSKPPVMKTDSAGAQATTNPTVTSIQNSILVTVSDETTPASTPEPGPSQEIASVPGETVAPTATRRAFGTATLPPPPTPTPRPPTPTPASQAVSEDMGAITLIEPQDNLQLAGDSLEFKWQWDPSCKSPPPGYGFEIRIWPDKPDAEPLGAMDAKQNQGNIKCDTATGIRSYIVGNVKLSPGVKGADVGTFRWDVVLVRLDQYELIVASESFAFELGGGGDGGDDGGDDSGNGGDIQW